MSYLFFKENMTPDVTTKMRMMHTMSMYVSNRIWIWIFSDGKVEFDYYHHFWCLAESIDFLLPGGVEKL